MKPSKEERNLKGNKYYSSKEVMKKLRITSCDLMHMREAGKLEFVKKGNAYLYKKKIVDSISI